MPQKEHAGNYRACTYEHLDVQLRAKKQRGFVRGSCLRESAASVLLILGYGPLSGVHVYRNV
jgi:hypothetical protein